MKLNDLVHGIRSGVVLGRVKSSDELGSEINYKVITVKSLREDGSLDGTLIENISVKDMIPDRYIAKSHSIVMRSSFPFTASIIEDENSGAIVPSNLCILSSISDSVLPEYLCVYLNTKDARKQLAMFTSQSTIQTISIKTIGEIEVNIPDLVTQQMIVNIARTARRESELLERLIDEKTKLNNYIIESLLSKEENR